jgi:hypothetical protein
MFDDEHKTTAIAQPEVSEGKVMQVFPPDTVGGTVLRTSLSNQTIVSSVSKCLHDDGRAGRILVEGSERKRAM